MEALEKLRTLVALAEPLEGEEWLAHDTRPLWLKEMPHACDPQARYYLYLYQLIARLGPPLDCVEIGTYIGTSAAHLAVRNGEEGGRGGLVVTIDINPDAARQVLRRVPAHDCLAQIATITDDSTYAWDRARVRCLGYDVLYVDGNHTFNQAYGEYYLYRQLLKPGGVMLFDDVGLQMATNEMEVFWDFVVDPKARLDYLHHTGFGIAVKDPAVEVLPWKAVIKEAERRMGR